MLRVHKQKEKIKPQYIKDCFFINKQGKKVQMVRKYCPTISVLGIYDAIFFLRQNWGKWRMSGWKAEIKIMRSLG